ncbi:unnamed protein product [Phytophthora lilii]|uniref:Unnamed protein product n=1 Tax=Phytophthora lilii TaxID=2077276 RepID=A0A9W6TKJ1_9STRA|nr:unnamed protein product [Phytophthora lilii]
MSSVEPVAAARRQSNASRSTPNSKKKSSKKKPRGWGPFQSVLKERSVDFNLTLDVQNLQQQIQDLTTLRDVLSTRTMLRRHSPEGSLFHVVKEYFHVFRTGWAVQESGRKRLLGEQDQREFLHSVMDPEVDVDNGLRGPDVMAEQIIMYSTFIKFIRLTMKSYDIVVADDAVIVKTNARLRFQVLRDTIEMIFPHVIGDECLVAQLVGEEVEPSIGLTFFFNSEGKCCRYNVDLDFVEAFSSIVKDPEKLDMLLRQALIADNCMFGLMEEPRTKDVVDPCTTFERALENERDRLVDELRELREDADAAYHIVAAPPSFLASKSIFMRNDKLFQKIVNDYYLVCENGFQRPRNQERDFLSQIFVPFRAADTRPSGKYVLARWRALCECFDVMEFRKKNSLPPEYSDQEDMCMIRSLASYTLRITSHTLESIFPHVLSNQVLVTKLAGSVINVSSQLDFLIETDTGMISHVVERMNFVESMSELLQNRKDVSIVLSRAQLSLDGVRCCPVTPILPPLACQDMDWSSSKGVIASEIGSSPMTMAGIFHS